MIKEIKRESTSSLSGKLVSKAGTDLSNKTTTTTMMMMMTTTQLGTVATITKSSHGRYFAGVCGCKRKNCKSAADFITTVQTFEETP
jgi:hypothetical protein